MSAGRNTSNSQPVYYSNPRKEMDRLSRHRTPANIPSQPVKQMGKGGSPAKAQKSRPTPLVELPAHLQRPLSVSEMDGASSVRLMAAGDTVMTYLVRKATAMVIGLPMSKEEKEDLMADVVSGKALTDDTLSGRINARLREKHKDDVFRHWLETVKNRKLLPPVREQPKSEEITGKELVHVKPILNEGKPKIVIHEIGMGYSIIATYRSCEIYYYGETECFRMMSFDGHDRRQQPTKAELHKLKKDIAAAAREDSGIHDYIMDNAGVFRSDDTGSSTFINAVFEMLIIRYDGHTIKYSGRNRHYILEQDGKTRILTPKDMDLIDRFRKDVHEAACWHPEVSHYLAKYWLA